MYLHRCIFFFRFFFQHAFVHYSSFSLSLRGLKLLPCACVGLCVFSPHFCCCSIYKYIIVSCSSLPRKTQFHSSFVTRDIHTFFFLSRLSYILSLSPFLSSSALSLSFSLFFFFSIYTSEKVCSKNNERKVFEKKNLRITHFTLGQTTDFHLSYCVLHLHYLLILTEILIRIFIKRNIG